MMPDKKRKREITTSKLILWATYILFASQIILAIVCTIKEIDTTVFVYTIPATATLTGATTVFYMNKSKMENVFRFKISFLEYKLDLLDKHPCKEDIVESEMSSIEDALDSKIDSTMREAVDEEINIEPF